MQKLKGKIETWCFVGGKGKTASLKTRSKASATFGVDEVDADTKVCVS
jgi:hypothetical protein